MKINTKIKVIFFLTILFFNCITIKANHLKSDASKVATQQQKTSFFPLTKRELTFLKQLSAITNILSLVPQIIDSKDKKHIFHFSSSLAENSFSAALEENETFVTSLTHFLISVQKACPYLQSQDSRDAKKISVYFTITMSKILEILSKRIINRYLLDKYNDKSDDQRIYRRFIRAITSSLLANVFYLIPKFVNSHIYKKRDCQNSFRHLLKGLLKNAPYFITIPITSEIIGEWLISNNKEKES